MFRVVDDCCQYITIHASTLNRLPWTRGILNAVYFTWFSYVKCHNLDRVTLNCFDMIRDVRLKLPLTNFVEYRDVLFVDGLYTRIPHSCPRGSNPNRGCTLFSQDCYIGRGGVGGSSGTTQLWSLPGVKHWLRQSPEFEHPVEGSDQRVDNVLL